MAAWSCCYNLVFGFVGFSGNSNREWITQACWSLPKSQTFISPCVPFFFPPALLQCVCRSKILVLAKEHRWRIVHLRGRLKQNQKSKLNVVSLYGEFSFEGCYFQEGTGRFWWFGVSLRFSWPNTGSQPNSEILFAFDGGGKEGTGSSWFARCHEVIYWSTKQSLYTFSIVTKNSSPIIFV